MPTADATLEPNSSENTSIVQIENAARDQRRIHVVVPSKSRSKEKSRFKGLNAFEPRESKWPSKKSPASIVLPPMP